MGPVESSLSALSRISIGSLADMGYQVDYSQADPINPNFFGSQCRCNRRLEEGDFPFGSATNMTSGEAAPRRELSEAGRAEAEAFGLSVLAENQEKIEQVQGLFPEESFLDIGGHVISVLYEEDGVAYDVVVRSGTLRL